MRTIVFVVVVVAGPFVSGCGDIAPSSTGAKGCAQGQHGQTFTVWTHVPAANCGDSPIQHK